MSIVDKAAYWRGLAEQQRQKACNTNDVNEAVSRRALAKAYDRKANSIEAQQPKVEYKNQCQSCCEVRFDVEPFEGELLCESCKLAAQAEEDNYKLEKGW